LQAASVAPPRAFTGPKHLIVGNNDGSVTTDLPGWASVRHYAETETEGTRLILCHYPLPTWNRIGRRTLNLHGHSHGRLAPLARQVDVGVDVWDFGPITLAEIPTHLHRRASVRPTI
jgi:calcineurin-like phosphoesterase family protein